MRVLRTKPRLFLQIEGHGRFAISQYTADFALNSIPRAVCALATGRNAQDGKTAARMHTERNKIDRLTNASVWCRLTGDFDEENPWPDKFIRIFDGKLLGFGHRKINGKVNFVAFLGHWLMDLSFSSAISSVSHPSNPTQYTFSATVGSLLTSGATPGKPFGMSQTAELESIRPEIIREDLWGQAIKPMLCAFAKQKHVRVSGALTSCIGLDAGTNDLALRALRRIEGQGNANDNSCDKELSCYTPQLSLISGGAQVPFSVASAISQAIRRESIDSFAGNTLWSKLLQYGGAFQFAVVPQVEKALVVPFIPGLRDVYCKRILSDDYDHLDETGELGRPVKAMAVYSGHSFNTGAGGVSRSESTMLGIGGCFAPETEEAGGMIYFIRPPAWLEGTPSTGFSVVKTLGLDKRRGTSSTTTPVDNSDDRKDAKDGAAREDIIRELAELYNGYAHAAYIQEALRGRSLTLSGKLRFDIAPGANVYVFGSREKFIGRKDLLGQALIADVARVSFAIDAESPRASTAIQLANHRTPAENKSDATSVARHPLYTTIFTGAPLLDELQFPNKECC